MAFHIDDVLLLDVNPHNDATTEIPISSNVGQVSVSLPESLFWRVAMEWRNDDKSILICSADVRDESGALLADGKLTLAEPPRSEVDLSPFLVTVTGTYTVRLYVGDSCVFAAAISTRDSEG